MESDINIALQSSNRRRTPSNPRENSNVRRGRIVGSPSLYPATQKLFNNKDDRCWTFIFPNEFIPPAPN